tara:strand:- start:29 stop:580 length:552 start_codon:yes stop_codon:yes gene_type:complete
LAAKATVPAAAAPPPVEKSEPAGEAVVEASVEPEPEPVSRPSPEVSAGTAGVVTCEELVAAWADDLLELLGRKARARFSAARFVSVEDGTAVMALPNEPHMRRCEDMRPELEKVLADKFGGTIPVKLVVGGDVPTPAVSDATASSTAEESIDMEGLVDADISEGSAVDRLTQAFPGASLVDPD